MQRRPLLALAVFSPLGTLLVTPAIAAPGLGQAAPDFTLTDTAGKPVKLSDFKGKTVVLEWTNHDCPYVRKHYSAGNLQEQQREAAAQGGRHHVGVRYHQPIAFGRLAQLRQQAQAPATHSGVYALGDPREAFAARGPRLASHPNSTGYPANT